MQVGSSCNTAGVEDCKVSKSKRYFHLYPRLKHHRLF
jgi:hypothetical protein